jgi:hypothetical protein
MKCLRLIIQIYNIMNCLLKYLLYPVWWIMYMLTERGHRKNNPDDFDNFLNGN